MADRTGLPVANCHLRVASACRPTYSRLVVSATSSREIGPAGGGTSIEVESVIPDPLAGVRARAVSV